VEQLNIPNQPSANLEVHINSPVPTCSVTLVIFTGPELLVLLILVMPESTSQHSMIVKVLKSTTTPGQHPVLANNL